jgi:hypothetical protein
MGMLSPAMSRTVLRNPDHVTASAPAIQLQIMLAALLVASRNSADASPDKVTAGVDAIATCRTAAALDVPP